MPQKNNARAYRRGFTLIELLVAISIIGLLSSVVIATLGSVKDKAKDARVKTEVHNIRLALEEYASTHGGYPYAVGTDNPSGIWCIGANDCKIANEVFSNNTDNWGIVALLQKLTNENTQYLAAVGDLFYGVDFSN